MNREVHVRFWIRGFNSNISSTVTFSHPGAETGPKGRTVRPVTWNMIWV